MSIFKRVLIVCILPMIVVLAAITFSLNDVIRSSMLDFSDEKSRIFAAQTAKQINDGFRNMQILLKVLGGHLAKIDYTAPDADEYTSEWAKSVVEMATNIYCVWYSFEPDGFYVGKRHARDLVRFGDSIVIKKDFDEDNLMDKDRAPWYYYPFTTGEMWFEVADLYDYQLGAGKQYTGTVSKPIRRNSKIIGVVGVDMLYDSIFSHLSERMMILTQSGNIAYSKNRNLLTLSIFEKNFPEQDLIRKKLQGDEFFTINGISPFFETESKMYFYPVVAGIDSKMLSEQLFLYVDFPISDIRELQIMQKSVLTTGILGLLSLVLILFFTMRSILKPIKKLTQAADEIADGNLDINIDEIINDKKEDDKNEVHILHSSLKKMIAELNNVNNLKLEAMKTAHEKEKAESASKAKSEFLAKMSHEIRTPMNAIIGMSELALREDLTAPAREQVSIIKRSSANLLAIINDILDFSKIESGKMEIVPVNYSLSSMLNDVVSIIKVKIAEPKVKFITEIDEKIPNWLCGDEVRIRQVLLNILSNAVKYTPQGSITFSVSGKIIENGNLILTMDVKDTGKGIKSENISKLFGDFAQMDLEANKGIEGTGLGLAITKNLINAMGGEISVSSIYGEGSTFSITLPQKIHSSEPISQLPLNHNNYTCESKTLGFIAPNAKVLIVDDIDTNIMVVCGLLNFYEIQTDTCLNGADAIEKVKNNAYDFVFMDHMMSEMDGIETTKRIREFNRDIPIIALTANAVSEMKKMFLENGFNDFLPKPIETQKLNNILEKWIPKVKQKPCEKELKSDEKIDLIINGIDIKLGMGRTGGTKNYLRTLEVFYKDGNKKIEKIMDCLKSGNYHLYTTHTHALKSALANIGAENLSEAANKLEIAGKQKNIDFINSQNEDFLTKLSLLLNNINEILSKNKKENQSIDPEVLRKLKNALAIYDLTAIDEAANILRNFKEAENIVEYILFGGYDEAAEAVEVLLAGN